MQRRVAPSSSVPQPVTRGEQTVKAGRGSRGLDLVPRTDDIDWVTHIDTTRWFLCETVTPLYYTAIYRDLSEEQRRRYNQLTGMFANELIAFLEREFLAAALNTLRTRAGMVDAGLADALQRFHRDEEHHLLLWRRLNALSDPARYSKSERAFLHVPGWLARLAGEAARRPDLFPVVLWIQLIQEERSLDISRRCLRAAPGRIEPRYTAVHLAHLRDEARHVQVDCELIERIYARRSRLLAWWTAFLLERLLTTVFLLPGRSTGRVIQAVAAEYPDLQRLLPVMRDQLRALRSNEEYLRMMCSRETTPVTFRMLDRFPEFRRLGTGLPYEPARRPTAVVP